MFYSDEVEGEAMCQVDWELVLKFVQVLLSWPVLAALVALGVSLRFDKELRALLGKGTINQIGPVVFGVDQPPLSPQALNPELPPPAEDVEPPPPAEEAEPSEPDPPNLDAATKEEFQKLDSEFVLATQLFLDALVAANGTLSLEAMSMKFSSLRPDQRVSILRALLQSGLVHLEDDRVTLTEKGRRYQSSPERQRWVLALEAIWRTPISAAASNRFLEGAPRKVPASGDLRIPVTPTNALYGLLGDITGGHASDFRPPPPPPPPKR